MIITPVTVTATVTSLVTAQIALSSKSIVLENVGSNTVRIRWDGGAETLTYANGITLAANEKFVLDNAKYSFHNPVEGICNTALTSTVNIHVVV